MKLNSITLLLLLSFSLWSCDKSSDELKDECLEVKILDEICGNAVVQILDPKLYEYGENGYQLDGVTYDHVFATRLSCADMSKLYATSSSLKGVQVKVKATETHEDDPQLYQMCCYNSQCTTKICIAKSGRRLQIDQSLCSMCSF